MTDTRDTAAPQYPEIQIHTESDNPFAWVAAVRLALRQAAVEHPVIDRFTEEALAKETASERRRICRSWVRIDQ